MDDIDSNKILLHNTNMINLKKNDNKVNRLTILSDPSEVFGQHFRWGND